MSNPGPIVELAHMRNFVAVVECGQFSRAAQRLHLSQPALSLSIKQLETRLGTRLFVRHNRGVSLTAAGEAFLPRARSAIGAAQAAVDAAQAHAMPRSLVVGFVPPWSGPAAQLLDSYRRTYPAVHVETRQLTLADQASAVRAHRIDVALAWEPQSVPGVAIEVLRREPRVVCLAASHPLAQRAALAFDDVADEPVPAVGNGVDRHLADALHLANLRTEPMRYARQAPRTLDETAALIAAGEAICMGPETLARAFTRPGLAIRPLLGVPAAEMSLVWRESETDWAVRGFIDLARRVGADDEERTSLVSRQ